MQTKADLKARTCWGDTAPAWTPAVSEIPSRVDVVVIGAGCAGLSAARTLARAGASVSVFEKGSLGDGASGRTDGQVLAGLNLRGAELVRRFGRARARSLFAASIDAISVLQEIVQQEAIDCDYRCVGHLEAAARAADFEEFKREQELLASEFGHHVDLVPEALQDTEIASTRYRGLLLDAQSAAIHPIKYLHGLARAAVQAGARIHERTAVTRVVRRGVGFEVVADGRAVVARDVVACPGGYPDHTLSALRHHLASTCAVAIATAPLDPDVARALLPRHRVCVDSSETGCSFRLSDDNRLVFAAHTRPGRFPASRPGRNAEALGQALVETFPQLRGVAVEYAWSASVGWTRDGLPRAGLLDGIHYVVGLGGRGTALATYLGMRTGECLLGRQADTPFHDLKLEPIAFYDRWRFR